MNKLFKKIATLSVGLAMAIGVGVAVGGRNESIPVHASSTIASSISVGDQVIITNIGHSKYLSGVTTIGTATDYSTSTPPEYYILTVEAGYTTGSFSFKNGNNYLSWSSGNSLATSATKNNASSWTVSFNDNNATVSNVGTTARKLQYNSGSPRFACYTSSQQLIHFYKLSSNTYTVKYDAKGGTGAPSSQTGLANLDSVTLASTSGMTLFGYTSTGWSRDQDGATKHYNSGATGVNLSAYADANKTVTLYAYWEAKSYTGLVYQGAPTKTTYTTDDQFDPSGITHIYAQFSGVTDTSNDLISSISWDPLIAGTTATGKYTIGSTTQTVTVTGLTITQVTSWTDKLTNADGSATSTTYSEKTNIAKSSSARYTMKNNKPESGKLGIRTSGSDSGIVSTTSGGVISSVSVENCQSERTIEVYGSNVAYTSPADLFNESKRGTKLGEITSSSSSLTITDLYEYVGVKSKTNATTMSSITFVWNLPPTDPIVKLDASSATSVSIMNGNPDDTSVKVLVKNIDSPVWSFTFDEGETIGKTSSSYVSVTASSLVDNVSTLTISTLGSGSTTMHISVSGTACDKTVPITVTPRPAAGTMVAKLNSAVVTDTVEVQTGAYKQFTFAAQDTDGNAYNIDAADVTGTKESGTATVTISGTRVTCDTKGTAVVRYKLNVLETVYVDISFNVIDDYLTSVNSVTFNTGLAATQGDSPAVAIFATRLGNTHFGSTADIPLEDFRFSYDDVMGVPSTQFGYDFNHGTTVDATHKLQTIYVYCTLGNVSCGSYSVLVEQKSDPLTAITISNVVDHKKDIARGSTFQLEIAFTPTNPTDGKGLVYRVDSSDEGVDIDVNSTGLISVAASSEFGNARIVVESDHNEDIYDYVDVTVILESMTYTVRGNPSWHLVSDPSTLVAGDQVILTGIKNEVVYAAGLYAGGNNVSADTEHTLTVSGDTVTGVVSTMIYTLETGTVEDSLAFKGSDNKYLCAVSSSSNYMYSTATLDDNASFILYDDGDVIAQGDYTRDHMRYNNTNTSNMFSCYKSDSTVGSVVTFYKLSGGDVEKTVTETLYFGVHDNFGNEGATYEWDALCTPFNSSNWLSACNALKGIEGYSAYELNRAYGDISGNEIEQFIAKYDIIIGKVGATYDYLGRFSGDGINANQRIGSSINFLKNSNINTYAIVIIVSVASVAAIGGYFFLRKKKED